MRHGRRTVAARIREIDRRFVAGHQTLVAVGGGSDDRRQRARVLQQSADVPERHLAQARVASPANSGLPLLPQALMRVHAAAVVAEQRLGHERHGLAVLVSHVADDVLVQHHVVGRLHQRVESLIDFALAAGGHFVVMALDVEAALDHGLHHFAAQILIVIGGRNGEIAFLVSRTVAEIVFGAPGIPAALFRIDEIKPAVLVLIEADVVEDEELGFRAEVRRVADTAILQVEFGFFRDPARVAIVVLPGDRVDDSPSITSVRVSLNGSRRPSGIGNDEHIALIDGRPSSDA